MLNGDYLVALQSTVGPDRCIGINEDGSLKTAQICASSSVNSLFGVLLIVRIHILSNCFLIKHLTEILLSNFMWGVFVYFVSGFLGGFFWVFFITDSN